jgi:hypothetical protein
MGIVGGQVSRGADDDVLVGTFFPYRAFERLPATRINVGGGTLSVAFGPGELQLSPGSGIRGGTTWGFRGAASRIQIGHDTTENQLARDWVLVHELVHHGLPNLEDEHHWMEEGLATYVEPIARAQAGELSVESVWGDMVKGLPQGLPRAGDEGLDHTHTWGRTYWGGALFYLLAEIEIRRRTDNRHGLQDALRSIVAAGGNISQSWSIEKVVATGDAGTDTHVLTELYGRMKDKPENVDLADLWARLGVSMQGETVSFDESAPMAQIRRAITAAPHPGQLTRP